MIINAIVDRIEDGKVILSSNEVEIEISIQACKNLNLYKEGDTISLTIDKSGNIESL